MLELHDIQVAYGAAPALWGVSLSLRAGELLCVVGPNGAGKTTLVNAIAGIQRTRGGRIVLDGRDITALAPHRYIEAGIAVVPEGRRLFTGMSVLENLELGSYLPAAKAQRAESLDAVLALFPDLKAKLQAHAGDLSGGQQQMVAIARALMARPKVLLLDEPSLGLAPMLVKEIFEALEKMKGEDGMAILVVEQNANLALAHAARAYVLEVGNVVVAGASDELRANESVRRSYLGY
jgi:branched-chain amino acid transport system ATP-binding protein